ncbi:hypothetical protein JCM8547_002927 [Rhodosporidiobolus lusitaniae]
MASVASSSRALFRSASLWARAPARPYSTAQTPLAASPSPSLESSSPAASPAPAPPAAPIRPLPGSAVLPEAFRSPSASSAPSPVVRSSPSASRDYIARHRLTQPYKLHVYATRNNTILTLSTSPSGGHDPAPGEPHHPIAWVSAGAAGYKGAARGTYDAAVEVSLKMFTKIKNLVEPPVLSGGQRMKAAGPPPTELEVVFKGFGKGRDAVFRTLMTAEGDAVRALVRRLTDATPLKIGGTRPKKRRVI